MRPLLIIVLAAVLALGMGQAAGGVSSSPVGSGSGAVGAPPVEVTAVEWMLASNPLVLDQVKVTLDQNPDGPLISLDVTVVLKEADGTVLGTKLKHDVEVNGFPATEFFKFTGAGIAVADIDSVSVTACYHQAGDTGTTCK